MVFYLNVLITKNFRAAYNAEKEKGGISKVYLMCRIMQRFGNLLNNIVL